MLDDAMRILRSGEVIAVPTDTVYGVIADATNSDAVAKIYALKARPAGQASQVMVNSMEMAESLAEFSPAAKAIAEAFWPGPLTLVLPYKQDAPISKSVCGSRPTIGVRWPQSEVVCEFVKLLGRPVVSSSVNVTGSMPLNTAEAIRDSFPRLAVIEGHADGVASTIAELKGDQLFLYRQGEITEEQLRQYIS